MPRKWSDLDLERAAHWRAHTLPDADIPPWDSVRLSLAYIRASLADLDTEIAAVESDPNLSVQGRARKIAELALEEIEAQGAASHFTDAERACAQRSTHLNKIMEGPPIRPNDFNAAMLATEIRNHILQIPKGDREIVLHSLKTEPAVASAVTTVPPFLSGLSQEQVSLFREASREALFPSEAAELRQLVHAQEILGEARRHAERLAAERGHLQQDSDGNWSARTDPPVAA
jgi:hypothetical protein